MSFGTLAVDFELRVDFARLRKDKLEKSRKALKNSGLGALVCFDQDNIRYITSATIGEWARDKLQCYCILPKDKDAVEKGFKKLINNPRKTSEDLAPTPVPEEPPIGEVK